MRKMFAAGFVFCSSVGGVSAQQPPAHHPVMEVQWVGSNPRALSTLPTTNPNIVYLPVAAVPPPPTKVVVTQLDAAVSKGEGKGPGRTVPMQTETLVPAGISVLPETQLLFRQQPDVPKLQPAPTVPMVPTPVPTMAPVPHAPKGTGPQTIIISETPAYLPHTANTGPHYVAPTPHVVTPLEMPMNGYSSGPYFNDGTFSPSYLTAAPRHCMWFNAEAVKWWLKNGPQNDPLVTTGSPADGALAGALGQPGTRVIYGARDLDYGSFWGVRGELGMWFDDANTVGLALGGFGTQLQSTKFFASDNGTGVAGLYIPARNVAGVPFENRLVIADAPLAFAGGVGIKSTTQLWGADANLLLNIHRGEALELTPFVGFRHISLNEELTINTSNTDLLLGTVTNTSDLFKTRNQMYGAQIGLHANLSCGNWTFGLTSKVALGFSQNVVRVQGLASQTTAAGTTLYDSGFFAQRSNTGRFESNNFAVVPEGNAKITYHVANWLSLSVGYDYLFWNTVARPGAQLNRNLNLTQSPIFGTGNLAGVAQPGHVFRTNDFYLHGVSAGIEFRY